MSNGYVIWEGASLLDGQPIALIATIKSSNDKTGNMVQTYIIGQDKSPIEMSRTGEDFSICGSCVHRGTANPDKEKGGADDRSCYVMLLMVQSVWNAYQRGSYVRLCDNPDVGARNKAIVMLFIDLLIRLGAYGDPSAVPSWVWDLMLTRSKGRTGYTHQFGVKGADVRPDLCMISADTEAEARVQWGLGNRTFRVGHTVDEMVKGHEILCPASEEAGRRTTCNECKLCSGNGIKAKSIFIPVHGSGKNNYRKVS